MYLATKDITELDVDAIVNPGNETLCGCFTPGHTCLDHQIHKKAGSLLFKACNAIMKNRTAQVGDCIITNGYDLKVPFIIHTYGPDCTRFHYSKENRKSLLWNTYQNCLNIAERTGKIKYIAFPTISTGIYGFPKNEAASIALDSVRAWLCDHVTSNISHVYFALFDKENTQCYQERFTKEYECCRHNVVLSTMGKLQRYRLPNHFVKKTNDGYLLPNGFYSAGFYVRTSDSIWEDLPWMRDFNPQRLTFSK